MDEEPLFDREALTRDIAEAIRAVIREVADECGLSYEEARDRVFAAFADDENGGPDEDSR
jgi:hypothetical protein